MTVTTNQCSIPINDCCMIRFRSEVTKNQVQSRQNWFTKLAGQGMFCSVDNIQVKDYCEVVSRLLQMTVDDEELEDQFVSEDAHKVS